MEEDTNFGGPQKKKPGNKPKPEQKMPERVSKKPKPQATGDKEEAPKKKIGKWHKYKNNIFYENIFKLLAFLKDGCAYNFF